MSENDSAGTASPLAPSAHDVPDLPCRLTGTVVRGKQLGRTVGMPTANLCVDPGVALPPDGVYAAIVEVAGERKMGLTNVGTRPSVDDSPLRTIETTILDFDRDIYDREMMLDLCFFIRGVQKFDGLEQVREQVERDKASAAKRLAAIYAAGDGAHATPACPANSVASTSPEPACVAPAAHAPAAAADAAPADPAGSAYAAGAAPAIYAADATPAAPAS